VRAELKIIGIVAGAHKRYAMRSTQFE